MFSVLCTDAVCCVFIHSRNTRNLLFLSNRSTLCNLSTFQYHFKPSRLCLRVAIAIRNYPTELHTQTQIRFSVCSLSHIPLFSLLALPANILWLTVWTGFVRTFDCDCHMFKTAASLNIQTIKSVNCALFFL